jgi:DNA invertase Pin-like site-specific DNA recombinase
MDRTLSGLRAVVAARVSHVQGPEKTSHHLQKDKGVKCAENEGWDVVGIVEDLDVSAIKLGPWDRPDLKQWLTDRRADFDVLIFTKTDRVFRRAEDSNDLCKWAKENRKILVLIDDGIRIDFYTPEDKQDPMTAMMSRMFLFMASFFAEMEGRRFIQRAQDRVAVLTKTDRWGYGVPPYGFKVVDHKTGKGKALAHDADMQEVMRAIVARLLSGDSIYKMTADLIESGVPSPQDAARIRRGRPAKGTRWTRGKLVEILSSPATQGVKTIKGKPALTAEGEFVMVGPPSFDDETWSRVQAELRARSRTGKRRRHTANALLNVGKCAICGKNLHSRTKTTPSGITHRYLYCGNDPRPCPKVSIVTETAEREVENAFLSIYKNRPVKQRVWQEGSDHSHELDQTNQTIESLREDREMGLYSTPEDEARYRTQMKALITRRDALAAQPIIKSGWKSVETGETYGSMWPDATPEERRKMLIDANVRLLVRGPKDYRVVTDLTEAFATQM